MTTEGRQPIDGALSPLPLERVGEGPERWREESGLTWRKLAARMDVDDRRGLELRLPAGPGNRLESGGNGQPHRDGHGG